MKWTKLFPGIKSEESVAILVFAGEPEGVTPARLSEVLKKSVEYCKNLLENLRLLGFLFSVDDGYETHYISAVGLEWVVKQDSSGGVVL